MTGSNLSLATQAYYTAKHEGYIKDPLIFDKGKMKSTTYLGRMLNPDEALPKKYTLRKVLPAAPKRELNFIDTKGNVWYPHLPNKRKWTNVPRKEWTFQVWMIILILFVIGVVVTVFIFAIWPMLSQGISEDIKNKRNDEDEDEDEDKH